MKPLRPARLASIVSARPLRLARSRPPVRSSRSVRSLVRRGLLRPAPSFRPVPSPRPARAAAGRRAGLGRRLRIEQAVEFRRHQQMREARRCRRARGIGGRLIVAVSVGLQSRQRGRGRGNSLRAGGCVVFGVGASIQAARFRPRGPLLEGGAMSAPVRVRPHAARPSWLRPPQVSQPPANSRSPPGRCADRRTDLSRRRRGWP